MLFLKSLLKYVIAFLLFVTVSGFSGISGYDTNFKSPQTEVIVSKKKIDNTTVNYCNSQNYTSLQVTVNHYTIFNFKSLLKKHLFNFNITFKSQKQVTLEFLDANSILEQNLIAYKNTSHTNNAFVK